MAKKNNYDTQHINNLRRYSRQIEEVYASAALEAAALGVTINNFNPNRPFSFADYPITKNRLDKLLSKVGQQMEAIIINGIKAEWEVSNIKNDELVRANIDKVWKGKRGAQHVVKNSKRYFQNNEPARDAFIARKTDGLNLSDRVWRYTHQFKGEIEMGLDLGLREGKSAEEMGRDLRQYLQQPDKLFRRVRDEHGQLHLSKRAAAYHPGAGVYRSSRANALRLTRTEPNIAYRTADFTRWQQLDFVVGIEIRLSNNHPCTDICDILAGKYPKDFKFTGWHPQCMCHAVPILKTMEEMQADNERIMSGEQVASESVNSVKDTPQKFKSWVSDSNERMGRAKSIPYFVTDNKKYTAVSIKDEAAKVAVAKSSLRELKQYWDIDCLENGYFVNGIVKDFDFMALRQELLNATSKYGISLTDFDATVFDKNAFMLRTRGSGFSITRTFTKRFNGTEVHHDFFSLDEKYQGKGISKEVFRTFYKQYGNIGVDYITVDANINIGGYTWAKYGFSAINKSEAISAVRGKWENAGIDFIEDYYKTKKLPAESPFPMHLITGQKWGKEALLGSSWEGVIDLRDKAQRKIFEKYLGL